MAKLSKLHPPQVPKELESIFRKVYDDLNDILHTTEGSNRDRIDAEGLAGDLKVYYDDVNKCNVIEGKSKKERGIIPMQNKSKYNNPSGNESTKSIIGNLSINTKKPWQPLTIKGTGDSSELLGFVSSANVNEWHMNLRNDGLNLAETGVADGRLFIKEGGNVGIGTEDPEHALDIRGGYVQAQDTNKMAVFTSGTQFTLEYDEAITICAARAGGLLISAYESGEGRGAVFFASYNTVYKITGHANWVNTDPSEGELGIYPGAGDHDIILKNKLVVDADKNFCIAILAGDIQ